MKSLTKADLARRDEIVKKLNDAKLAVDEALGKVNALIDGDLAQAIGEYNEIVNEATGFRDDLVSEMESYADGRSEKWTESERGESFAEWKSEWENLVLDELEAIALLDPPEMEHAETLEGAPVELS